MSTNDFIILLIILGCLCCKGDIVFPDTSEIMGNYEIVSVFGNFPEGDNLTLLSEDFIMNNQTTIEGSIILVYLYTPEVGAQLYEEGAIGIIIQEAPACTLGFQWEASVRYVIDLSQVKLPVAVISFEDFFTISSVSNNTSCSIKGLGLNEWVILEGEFLVVTQVIFTLLYSICILYAFYLLVGFWNHKQLKFNIATCCIFLELFGCILRLAWLFDNPLTFKYAVADAVVVTLHIPFSIVCGLLMVFFWQDTASKSTKVYQFLSKKFFYGAIALSVLIIICELALDIFYATYPGGDTNNTVWFVVIDTYSSIFAILAILYCFTCTRALIQIKGIFSLSPGNSDKRFFKLTIKVLLSGIGMIISAFQLIINAPIITPAVFIAWLWCAYLGPFVQTLPELLLFGTQPQKKKKDLEMGSSISNTSSTPNASQ